MEIYVNGKTRPAWRRIDDRNVQLRKAALPLSGRLLARASVAERLEAAAKRKYRIVFTAVAAGMAVSLVTLAAGNSGKYALAALGLAGFVAINTVPETGRDRRALQRIDANRWPAPGSEIVLTADEVNYAGEPIAWTDLEPVRLDVMALPGDTDDMEIDSLEARAGDRRVVFHRYAWENGAEIVDAAYLRLVRECDTGV